MNALALPLPGNERLAARLGASPGVERGSVETRRFPDGETYLRISDDCAGRRAVVVCTLDHPDTKLAPLLFLADAAREAGATDVGLVAPYLAYLRQDARFNPGEAVTSRTVGRVLSGAVDWLVTVDPHLHRYRRLDEVYAIPTTVVASAPAVAAWIAAHVERPVVVGPDTESEQWVSDVATRAGASHLVLRKQRLGDRAVKVDAPAALHLEGQTPVIVDDIVSSGETMSQAVRALIEAGASAPICVAVHALFAEADVTRLLAAGAAGIVSTNTVPHSTNAIDVDGLIVQAVEDILGRRSPAD